MEDEEVVAVACSSAEAEYRAMVVGTRELLWPRSLLLSLGVHLTSPMQLFATVKRL